MELGILLKKLSDCKYQRCTTCNYSLDIQQIKWLEEGQTDFQSSVLYMTESALLPPSDTPGAFAILCFGPLPTAKQYQNASFIIFQIEDPHSWPKLFNSIQALLNESQDITASMHVMVNAMLSDRGLQYLIDSAARVLGNPIYVVDLKYTYLAISDGIAPSDHFFQEQKTLGYLSDQAIAFIRGSQIDATIRKRKNACYFFNEFTNFGMLADSITMQGIEIGHIMLQESEKKFGEFDADLLHRLSKLVAIELQKDSIFTRNRGVMYSYFLSDLIENTRNNYTLVKKRLDAAGYHLKEYLYIITIPSSSYQQSRLRLETIIQQVRSFFSDSMYTIHRDNIVFLTGTDKYSTLNPSDISRLKDFLSVNHLKAGISNFFQDIKDISRFYKQAVDSVILGNRLDDNTVLLYYSDYYIYHIFKVFEGTDVQLEFLIHPGLMQLLYYDKEKNTDLIKTLQEYLLYPGHSSVIAENLHIHKNTLLYRMQKIKDLTNCNFDNGEDFLNFGLSFKIMKYLNML